MELSQLTEISEELRSYSLSVETSPERLAQVEARLSSLENLKRKYGGSIADVLNHRSVVADEIATVVDSKSEIRRREDALRSARNIFMSRSNELSKHRRVAASKLKSKFEDEIGGLAIPDCVFDVRISINTSDEDWREIGVDDVEFFFSANAGEQPRSLARTASGGELSRVMLALKTLGTTDVARKTLVFDEVDAGVGGAAAERIGRRLAKLGREFQVLSVTHAPQVAVHGDEHFTVRKSVESGRSVTTIGKLMNDAMVIPTKKDGKSFFMFQYIKKESIYEQLGLKPKDIILEINGFVVDTVDKALKLLEVLQSEREIALIVEREGSPVNFHYYID